MNAHTEKPSPVLGAWLRSETGPRNVSAVGDAVRRYCEQRSLVLSELWTSDGTGDVRSAPFAATKFFSALSNNEVARVGLGFAADTADEITVHLRPGLEELKRRGCQLRLVLRGETLTNELEALLVALENELSVSQGMVSSFVSADYASVETNLVLMKHGVDDETSERQWNDLSSSGLFGTKLRRLYPVTIIGKAIWESLPPLPALERPPEVRDLGDCKMLIAWPELCSPHDPEFLAGTRELRQWLWPYTIQNPYDKLDLDV